MFYQWVEKIYNMFEHKIVIRIDNQCQSFKRFYRAIERYIVIWITHKTFEYYNIQTSNFFFEHRKLLFEHSALFARMLFNVQM